MTLHDRYALALRECGFIPSTPKRYFGSEGEVFIVDVFGKDADDTIVWAYCDYGFRWYLPQGVDFRPELLPDDLFKVNFKNEKHA